MLKDVEQSAIRFRCDGYVILRGVVEDRRCEMIKEVAKVHMRYLIPPIESEEEYHAKDKHQRQTISGSVASSNVTLRRLRQAYSRDMVFREWMRDPLLLPLLKRIVDDEVELVLAHHNSIMTKMPTPQSVTHWHQDIRYWRYDNDNLVSVWLALGKEVEKNGSLWVVPGSHTMHFEREQFDEKEYFRSDFARNQALLAKGVNVELERGDVLLFHARLLHSAKANLSDEPKISLVHTVKAKSNSPIPATRSAAFGHILLG